MDSAEEQEVSQESGESGAILPLVALLAALLLVFAGFALDGTLLATSKAQQRHSAEYIALGALNAFQQSGSSDNWGRLTEAVERAKEVAGQNVVLAEPFLKYPEPTKYLGSEGTGLNDANGEIIPGVWYFQAGIGDCAASGLPSPCPCNGSSWATPCFRKLDFNVDTESPNAFRVILRTSQSSPIQTIFARVLGPKEFGISSSATAAVIPRRAMFLLDLSRSSQIETHIPIELTTGASGNRPIKEASEYAFPLDSPSCPADHSNPCLNDTSDESVNVCTISGGVTAGVNDAVWSVLPVETSRVGASKPQKHYRSDYKCYNVTATDELEGPVLPASYLIDTYTGLTNTGSLYDGPEPLNTMLVAVQHAVAIFKKRRISGDRIGLIGFDWSARVSERTFYPPDSISSEFDLLESVTTIEGQDLTHVESRIGRLLFPANSGNANIPEALTRAHDILISSPGAEAVEGSVVLLSDGIGNCRTDRNCGLDYNWFTDSLTQSLDILQTDYVQSRLSFSLIMIGQSNPHTLLRVNASGGNGRSCLSETEAQLTEPPLELVDYTDHAGLAAEDAFLAMLRGQGNFFGANQLYQGVRATGGLWLPIRPCCSVGMDGECLDIRAEIEDLCNSSSGEHGTTVVGSYTDSVGRLLCDPTGLDRRAQVRAAVDEILGTDSYVLVGPDS